MTVSATSLRSYSVIFVLHVSMIISDLCVHDLKVELVSVCPYSSIYPPHVESNAQTFQSKSVIPAMPASTIDFYHLILLPATLTLT